MYLIKGGRSSYETRSTPHVRTRVHFTSVHMSWDSHDRMLYVNAFSFWNRKSAVSDACCYIIGWNQESFSSNINMVVERLSHYVVFQLKPTLCSQKYVNTWPLHLHVVGSFRGSGCLNRWLGDHTQDNMWNKLKKNFLLSTRIICYILLSPFICIRGWPTFVDSWAKMAGFSPDSLDVYCSVTGLIKKENSPNS